MDNSFENKLWVQRKGQAEGEKERCFLMHHKQVVQFWFLLTLPLLATGPVGSSKHNRFHTSSHPAAYKIFTLTFQIYILFTLDSIKHLHVMLNIFSISLAPCLSATSQGDCLDCPQNEEERRCQGRVKGWHSKGQKKFLSTVQEKSPSGRSRTLKMHPGE